MKAQIDLSVPIQRTARVMQAQGLFDLPMATASTVSFAVDLPIEDRPWHIGLIVGPSGCGKSTVVQRLFADSVALPMRWPPDRSVLDGFPEGQPIKEITELLSSVGFSSPPSWLRPYRVLSNGERFRVSMAHALAQNAPLTVIDEFTSVIDRQVAQVGSAAIARTVRSRDQKFIAASCHYDILEWLDPDWVYEPHLEKFRWRSLQGRPTIPLTIARVDRSAWQLFRRTHYLDANLASSAHSYCAFIDDVPVAFLAMLSFPHATTPGWRISRVVCLPDYQGVGIGSRLGDFLAGCYKATDKPVRIVMSHPALIRSYSRSPRWRMIRSPSLVSPHRGRGVGMRMHSASTRLTAAFEYVGPARRTEARGFGIV